MSVNGIGAAGYPMAGYMAKKALKKEKYKNKITMGVYYERYTKF